MKKWVCRLSIVCCLCLFFTSVKAQLSLGGLGDILNSSTVNKVVSAIAGTDASLTVADLAGTWKYSAPACKFESSDFLKSAGGEVVAASLKTKLATYYTKAGITPSRVSFAFADTTFVMKYGNAKLNGHIVKDEESGRFVVTFTAVGGYIPIMVMDAVINKNGNTLEMLFDVDRFVKVLTTIASKSQSSTLKSVGGLLDEYEGVLMGFELEKYPQGEGLKFYNHPIHSPTSLTYPDLPSRKKRSSAIPSHLTILPKRIKKPSDKNRTVEISIRFKY